MKKLLKVIITTLITLTIITSTIVPHTSAAMQWITVKEDVITPGMYVTSHTNNDPDNVYFVFSPNNPDRIEVKMITYAWWDEKIAKFTYDNGKDNLGGYVYRGNTQIRATVYWHLTGNFDGGRYNYILFSYKLFYMTGSSKTPVGTFAIKYTSETNYQNQELFHTLYPSSAIPPNVKLFVEISFEIRAKGGAYTHNFADAPRGITLDTVRYQEFSYVGGGI